MRRRHSKSAEYVNDQQAFYDMNLRPYMVVQHPSSPADGFQEKKKEKEGDSLRAAYLSALIDVKVAEEVQRRVQALSLQQCERIHHSYEVLAGSVRHGFECRSRDVRTDFTELHFSPPPDTAAEGLQWRYQDAVDAQRSLETALDSLKRLEARSQQILLCRNMDARLFLELAESQERELTSVCDIVERVKNRAAPFNQLCNSVGEATLTFSDSRSVSALEKISGLIHELQYLQTIQEVVPEVGNNEYVPKTAGHPDSSTHKKSSGRKRKSSSEKQDGEKPSRKRRRQKRTATVPEGSVGNFKT